MKIAIHHRPGSFSDHWIDYCEKRILPSFLSSFRLKQLLGHIQCESHRDVLLYGLNKTLIIQKQA